MNLAEQIVADLEKRGVARAYGLIGTSILDFVDALNDSKVSYISTRQDQSAVSMAVGEGKVTNGPGVAAVHGGPGFLNSLTAIAIASKDCIPVIVITGAVKRRMRGLDAWLEVDQKQIAQPLVKSYMRVEKASDANQIIERAFSISSKSPKGPVVVECSEDSWQLDITAEVTNFQSGELSEDIVGCSNEDVNNVVKILNNSKAPLILAGGGINNEKGARLLLSFGERFNIPVVTTGNGRGVLPETFSQSLGRVGFGGGSTTADYCLRDCDFLLCLGAELSDVSTYGYNFIPHGEIVRINLDPLANKKPIPYSISLDCDAISFLELLGERIGGQNYQISDSWKEKIESDRKDWDLLLQDALTRRYENYVNPSRFFRALDDKLKDDTIIAAGQGLHILYAHFFLKVRSHSSFLSATNLGAMGYALPAAFGAKATFPNKEVLAVIGDGEFMMNLQEIETATREKIGVKIIVVNDNSYRVLLMRQRLQKMGRIKGTVLGNPDFEKLGDAFGIGALSLANDDGIDSAVRFVLYHSELPRLLELKISPEDIPPLNIEASLRF
jgi:acetolactate synthase I/II/III large subunit